MKAVLISIRPKWCELIASGKKTIEVRKTRPKIETPFKCYIYCTKPSFPHEDFLVFDAGKNKVKAFYGGGTVIGEFACDRVFDIEFDEDEGYNESYSPLGFSDCLTDDEFDGYLRSKSGYGWHISDLIIYDVPKKLNDFWVVCQKPFCGTTCKRYPTCGATADWRYPITRPPQSWCYVEELEGGNIHA